MYLGAQLPNDDAASPDDLAGEDFDTTPLAGAVAAVSRAAACLFMSHIYTPVLYPLLGPDLPANDCSAPEDARGVLTLKSRRFQEP
jgi:hypothetical protein